MSQPLLSRKIFWIFAKGHFDGAYYLKANADVARSGINPFRHFMNHGWREGRNPSPEFNILYFKDAFLDGALDQNPLLVYARGSRKNPGAPPSQAEFLDVQKRVVGPFFDDDFYKSAYGFDPTGSSDPLTHYLTEGWRLGREPNRSFKTSHYLEVHPFITTLDIAPFYHFASLYPEQARTSYASQASRQAALQVLFDSKSARQIEDLRAKASDITNIKTAIAPYFDERFYVQRNDDVRKAGIDPLDHFARFGWKEGRDPSPLFNVAYYLGANKAVRASGINPLFHFVEVGEKEGILPNPIGRRLWPNEAPPDDPADWAKLTPAADLDRAEVVVVMPVYKGYNDTLSAIYSVLANRQQAAFALMVINDCGPDPKLIERLQALAALGLFTYLQNETNLGFVKTTNRGMAEAGKKDVILLNSDVVVYGDWIDRLLRHAKADAAVATITPLSNNASICSYPAVNHNNMVELEIERRDLDQLAAIGNKGAAIDVPTGVGFCFYMRRKILDEIGDFDTAAFGRGYGEENDYCMRASKAGYRNILAHDIFVYHAGQVSFSSFVDEEFEPGQKALVSKHPDYPIKVRRFCDADTGWEFRLRLDLMRLARASREPTIVFVVHAWTGGILTHTDAMATALEKEGYTVHVVRVGTNRDEDVEIVPDARQRIFVPSLRAFSILKYPHLLHDFLRSLEPELVHVHSLAGLKWAAAETILNLVQQSGLPYAYTLHDYFVVCHRNNLTLTDGTFCHLPDTDRCRACIRSDALYTSPVDPDRRRKVCGDFLASASRVYAPSDDVRIRMERVFPTVGFTVRPHETALGVDRWRIQPSESRPLRVAAIGAIGPHKGSNVLHMMATDIRDRGLPIELHVVGYTDIDADLKRLGVRETGQYRDDQQVFELLDEIDPHLLFYPSIWPETFCYTLSLAFAAGIPPVAFDIGAPAERLRAAKTGLILPYGDTSRPRDVDDALLAADLDKLWGERVHVDEAHYPSVAWDYYGFSIERAREEPTAA